MEKETIYDISEVCRMLETTSRTLRFYEEKGLIQSTALPFSTRRHYTNDQVERIRRVLLLRSLGLSVKALAQMQGNDGLLYDLLLQKRAQIGAKMESMKKEAEIINHALALLDHEMDIFSHGFEVPPLEVDPIWERISRVCTEAVVKGDTELIYGYMSEELQAYLPKEAYERARADTLHPLGAFVAIAGMEAARHDPREICWLVRYENMGLKIRYVFCEEKIHGLWLGYYESEK